ncbi:MAG: GNAT family N-acetyltransferase [Oscillospiraceae bacterium]
MSREPYTSGEGYVLFPLADVDRDNYVELHRQLNGESSLFLMPIIKDMMWETTLNNERDKQYSIYEDNGEYCGCIELQKYQSDTPEIGLNLLESKRNQGLAAKVVKLLVQKACREQNIDYFLIKIMSNNSHSQHVFEKMGAIQVGEEERPFVAVMKELKQIESEEISDDIYGILKANFDDKDDNAFVLIYKLPPEALL